MLTQEYIFSGKVQNVGFRYTTNKIAKKYQVTGYVKNLPTGSVQIEIQGDLKELNGFIAEIKEYFSENIQDISKNSRTSPKKWDSFTITY